MKKIILILLLVLFLVSTANSQSPEQENVIHNNIEKDNNGTTPLQAVNALNHIFDAVGNVINEHIVFFRTVILLVLGGHLLIFLFLIFDDKTKPFKNRNIP